MPRSANIAGGCGLTGITGWGWPLRVRFPRSLGGVSPHDQIIQAAHGSPASCSTTAVGGLASRSEAGLCLVWRHAIALRLGHRTSVDFGFFTDRSLDKSAMKAAFLFLAGATVLQERPETLTVLIPGGAA